jgi:hydrogenase maturation protease
MNPSSVEQLVNAVLYEGYILYPYRPSSKKNQRERFTFGRVYPSAYSVALHGSERCMIQTECLLHCPKDCATLEVSVRFLQPIWREIRVIKSPLNGSSEGKEPEYRPVRELLVGGRLYQSWQEAVEREVKLAPIPVGAGGATTAQQSGSQNSQSRIANGKWQMAEPGFCADKREIAQPTNACIDGCTVSHSFAFPSSRTFEALSEDATGCAVGVIVRRQEAVEGVVEVKAAPAMLRNHRPRSQPNARSGDSPW